jgi:histidinol phosphatase-like enzyme (inositol monophosphatase family)
MGGMAVDTKGTKQFDPVTEADRGAERAMRAVLTKLRPDDAILGEEYGETQGKSGKYGKSGRVWTIDPIDGTRSFISGLVHWGTLLSLSIQDKSVLGVFDQPYIGERFIGFEGESYLEHGNNPKIALQVRNAGQLENAILVASTPDMFALPGEWDAFMRVSSRVKMTRFGSESAGYALLAAGCIDLVIEANLQAYDIRAHIPIIENAGGIVTNWDGGSAHDGGRIIGAGDRKMHEAALNHLAFSEC